MCQIDKKMSNCQKDVKCQKVKDMDYGGGSQKKEKEIDTMRFTDIDINLASHMMVTKTPQNVHRKCF